jgi:hypothetical protein
VRRGEPAASLSGEPERGEPESRAAGLDLGELERGEL